MTKAEEYLDEKFPKGKTKFRGEAMVLLALSRMEGKKEERERFNELFDEQINHREKLIRENNPHHDKVIPYWKNENLVLQQLKETLDSPKGDSEQ